ncbi:MAG: 1,4-dihydroxy-2-naphthoate polyprenyltransferase [Actinobacteria bacterium]|nr:1,4-dihydroxy-2-naphthoate polyprenyltransferase [Actinomycetota bacterium]
MTSANEWWLGARPRTLPAAVVPVLIGTAVAYDQASDFVAAEWLPRAALALVVSLALQVGVNYANDYSDGVRGTDDDRAGPMRLVASHRATPRAVKVAAFTAFGAACVAGLVLAAFTTWWLIALGVVCVVAGWTYTGGPRPYGYVGLGEVFVFVFFGLVATIGTTYVVIESVSVLAVCSGVLAGLLAVALLMVNNIRDIDGDARSGKQTLAVRLGVKRSKNLPHRSSPRCHGWAGNLCRLFARRPRGAARRTRPCRCRQALRSHQRNRWHRRRPRTQRTTHGR